MEHDYAFVPLFGTIVATIWRGAENGIPAVLKTVALTGLQVRVLSPPQKKERRACLCATISLREKRGSKGLPDILGMLELKYRQPVLIV